MTHTTILPILTLLISACSAPLPLYVLDTRHEQPSAVVEDACAVLQLECVRAYDARHGAIAVILTDRRATVGDRRLGGESFARACGAVVWSSDDTLILAHELGHALGLDHVESPDRLMHPQVGTWVTQDELDTVAHQAWELGACL